MEECAYVYKRIKTTDGPIRKFPLVVKQPEHADDMFYISHFLICPEAKKFSGRNKKLEMNKPAGDVY